MNKTEAERIADRVHRIRHDWSPNGVMTILADERLRNRPARDVDLALTALAYDPQSQKPTRIFEAGPWWDAARLSTVNTTDSLPVIDFNVACHECLKPFEHLWHGNTGTEHDHAFVDPRKVTPGTRPEGLR